MLNISEQITNILQTPLSNAFSKIKFDCID